MNLSTGQHTLRSAALGSNPEVAKVVSNAASLVQDLKGLTALQGHISRVTADAADSTRMIAEDPANALAALCKNMRELVCSYVYTYDKNLSPLSSIPSLQTYTRPGYQKDPAILEANISSSLAIPSIPGNLYYLAAQDNLETYNPVLYSVYQTEKLANPEKSDAEIISELLPFYAFNNLHSGALAAHPDLLSRWGQLTNLSATETWTLSGSQVSIKPEADEVIAIAGFRTVNNYKCFMALRYLDTLLDQISYSDANIVVSLYQQYGADPTNYGVWLSKLKTLCKGKPNISNIVLDYLADKRLSSEVTEIWSWISTTPSIEAVSQDLQSVILSVQLDTIESLSKNYISGSGSDNKYDKLILSFDGQAPATVFAGWKQNVKSYGGVLGFEAFALVASLTALDRVKKAAELNLSDEIIEGYAAEGYRLSAYVSNGQVLREAFKQLKDTK